MLNEQSQEARVVQTVMELVTSVVDTAILQDIVQEDKTTVMRGTYSVLFLFIGDYIIVIQEISKPKEKIAKSETVQPLATSQKVTRSRLSSIRTAELLPRIHCEGNSGPTFA